MAKSHSLSRRLLIGAAVYSLIMLLVIALILAVLNRRQQIAALDFELQQDLTSLSRSLFDCSLDPSLCNKLEEDFDEEEVAEAKARTAASTDIGYNPEDDDGVFSLGINPADLIISDTEAWALQRRKLPADPDFFDLGSGRFWGVAQINTEGDVVTFIDSFDEEFAELQPNLQWTDLFEVSNVLDTSDIVTLDTTGFRDDAQIIRIAAQRVKYGDFTFMLVVSDDLSAKDTLVNVYIVPLFVAFSVFAVGLIIFLIVIMRLGLRPMVRARQDVIAIREGERERLDADYPIELQPLADEVNKLLDHNKEVVERARTQVGNLAHALKTPIAVLMNEVATSDDNLSQLVKRQAQRMQENVQHYLARAQAAARAQALGARCEVVPAVSDLTRLLNRLYSREGIEVSAPRLDPVFFRGERQDLDDMIGNLMENACKWASSTVQASVEATSPRELTIHIDDDGPGLTPDERVEAMKRGVRLDETAPGTGLGLSIVKELAELYSGEFLLDDSPLGGLRATLILPRVSPNKGRN